MYHDINTKWLGLGDIIRLGWQIFTANFSTVLPIVLIVYGPFLAILVLLFSFDFSGSGGMGGFFLIQQTVLLVCGIAALISNVALAHMVEKKVLGDEISWKEAIRFGARRWGAAFWTNLLAMLILSGLSLLLVIPGIIWSVYYNFALMAVANRGLSGKKALDYSKALVRGQWWRVLGYQLAMLGGAGLVGVVINLALAQIFPGAVVAVFNSLVTFAAGTILSIMTCVWFLNIDYRRNSPALAESGMDFHDPVEPSSDAG